MANEIFSTNPYIPAKHNFSSDVAGSSILTIISMHIGEGSYLHEIIPNDKKSPEFKMALARLYNAGTRVRTLIEHFGFSYPTCQRRGEALKSGDMERRRFRNAT